jgi:hypothetical protein
MIGYVCGGLPVIAKMPLQVVIRRGASDACLAPYHVFRSKAVVIERFAGHPFIDGGAHCARHRADPLSDTGGNDHAETDTEAGLLRAADLIGPRSNVSTQDQCAFLRVRRDGVNGKLGYSSPADLAQRYPVSFGPRVEPYIRDARRYLEQTVEGRQWLAQLYSNVFAMQHNQHGMGPHLST